MVFPDFSEEAVDIPPDVLARGLNAGNDLRHVKDGYEAQSVIHTWGITSSQVSTSTVTNPELIAWLTSTWSPYLNHSVSNRRVSWRVFSFRKLMEVKKPNSEDVRVRSRTRLHQRTLDGLGDMQRQVLRWDIRHFVLRLAFQIANDVEMCKCPRVLRLVPRRVVVGSQVVGV